MTGIKLVVLILTCGELCPSARSQYYPGRFSNSYSPSYSSSGESASSPWTSQSRYPSLSQTKSSFPKNPSFGQRQGYGFGRPSGGFENNSGFSSTFGSSPSSSYYSSPSYSSGSNPIYSAPSDSYSNPSLLNGLDGFNSVSNSQSQSFSPSSGSFSSNSGSFNSNSGGFSSNTGSFTNEGSFTSSSNSGGFGTGPVDENGYYIKYPERETGQQYFEGETLVIKDFSDTYSSYNQESTTKPEQEEQPVKTTVVKIIGPNGEVSETIVNEEENSIPNSYLPPPEVVSSPLSPPSPVFQPVENVPINVESPSVPFNPSSNPNPNPNATPSPNPIPSPSGNEEEQPDDFEASSFPIDQDPQDPEVVINTPDEDSQDEPDLDFGDEVLGSNALNFDGEVYAFDGPSESPQEIDNDVNESNIELSTEEQSTQALEETESDSLTFGQPNVNSLDVNEIPVELVRPASDTTFVTVTDEPSGSMCPDNATCIRWIHCKSNNGKFAGMCGFGEFNVCCMSDQDLSHLIGIHYPTPSETTTIRISTPNVPEQELPIFSTASPTAEDVSTTISGTTAIDDPTTPTVLSTTEATTPLSTTTASPTSFITETSPSSTTTTTTTTTKRSTVSPTEANTVTSVAPSSTTTQESPETSTPSLSEENTFYQIPSQEYTKPFAHNYTKFTSASSAGHSYHTSHHHQYKYPTYAPHTSKIPDFGSALYSSHSTITKMKDKTRPQGFDEALFNQPEPTTAKPLITTVISTTSPRTTTSKPSKTRFKARPFAFNTNRFGLGNNAPSCSAAMLCVKKSFCSLLGEVMEKPQQISDMVRLFSGVPLITCDPVRKLVTQPSTESNSVEGDIEKDEIHVCCRDTNYFDPWP